MSANLLARSVIASIVLAAAALLLVGGEAHARVKGPRFDSLSAGCGALQDRYDEIMEQFKNGNLSQAQYDALLQEGRNIVSNWNSVCAGTFGNINYIKLVPKVIPNSGKLPTLKAVPTTTPAPSAGTTKLQPRSVLLKKK